MAKGAAPVEAHISFLLIQLNAISGRDNLESNQIDYFASMFMTEYKHEKIEDLVIILQKVLQGGAVSHYRGNKLDIETLQILLSDHLEEKARSREVAHNRRKQSEAYQETERRELTKAQKEKGANVLTNFVQSIEEKHKARRQDPVSEKPDESARRKLIDYKAKLFNDWAKFKWWYEQRKGRTGKGNIGWFESICPLKYYVTKHEKRFIKKHNLK